MRILRIGTLGLLAIAITISSTGCGGIASSHSVSPASFLLPGIIRNETPKPVVPTNPSFNDAAIVAVR
jgi:hypothetical protein